MMIIYALFTVACVIATIQAFWTDSRDKFCIFFATLIVAYMFSILQSNYEMFRQEKQRNQVESDRYDYFLNHSLNPAELFTDKTAILHV
jgi:hypothetical protein